MRLLVTGASGLLGLNLSLVAAARGYDVSGLVHSRNLIGVPFTVHQVDLLNTNDALAVILSRKPEAIIHCAALADLNKAEGAPALSRKLNSDLPGILAERASSWGIPFVHISTDAVFGGRQESYTESDQTRPLSVYAQTKLAGEGAVLDAYPDAVVARVVFYGWSLSGTRSLSEFFFNNLKIGNQVKGFVDTFFCPLYVEELAECLLEIISKGLSGLYHVVSPEHLSKYDFGMRIARRYGFNTALIEPVRMQELVRGAQRSSNLVLKPDKLQEALGHALPMVDVGIERFYLRWQEGYNKKLQGYSI